MLPDACAMQKPLTPMSRHEGPLCVVFYPYTEVSDVMAGVVGNGKSKLADVWYDASDELCVVEFVDEITRRDLRWLMEHAQREIEGCTCALLRDALLLNVDIGYDILEHARFTSAHEEFCFFLDLIPGNTPWMHSMSAPGRTTTMGDLVNSHLKSYPAMLHGLLSHASQKLGDGG